MYRKPSPSLPWEIISVPVVRPAYGTTGLLLMCPMGHQLKLIIYQGGILYEKVENYLLKSQDIIDMDWSITKQFAATCRYSTDCQALAFHKPVQPAIRSRKSSIW